LKGGEALPVAIRLKRYGRKKRPFYRVVVADTRDPRQGTSVDNIGYYDPLTNPSQIQINEEKALKWLNDGAQPTDTVKSLLSKAGILQKFHEQKHPVSNVEKTEQSDSEQEVGS
jgi:small subunit ribosomal protein S16